MLLRDEKQMALNRVEDLLFAAAEQYENAATRTGDAALRDLFSARAQEHRSRAAGLAEHIRRSDDLPTQPDPDRETANEIISEIKALFSADADRILIDERLAVENELEQAAGEALAQDFPPDTRTYLEHLQAESENAKAKLVAMRR